MNIWAYFIQEVDDTVALTIVYCTIYVGVAIQTILEKCIINLAFWNKDAIKRCEITIGTEIHTVIPKRMQNRIWSLDGWVI